MGARGQRTGRQSAPRPPSGADVLQAVCLARGHRPPAWGRSLGGLEPRGTGARGLPAGAEGVNRSARGGGRKRSPRRAYSLAHTPGALISASLPGRACRGRSPGRSPAGPAGGAAAAPGSRLPTPRAAAGTPQNRQGRPGRLVETLQRGFFGQEGSFPLPFLLPCGAGPGPPPAPRPRLGRLYLCELLKRRRAHSFHPPLACLCAGSLP